MFRKKVWIALIVVVGLNAAIILLRMLNDAKWTTLTKNIRARETQELSSSYRFAPKLASNDPYFLIGGLAKYNHWTKVLPLAKEQAQVLMKLDDLVRDANYHSLRVDADYMDGNPADYRQYARRNTARRTEAIMHAERMVALGLLTEAQAAFVMQNYLTTKRHAQTIGDKNVQELLGMSKEQKAKLEAVWETQNFQQAGLNLMSVNTQVQKKNAAAMENYEAAANAAALNILSPSQREIWDRLTAKRSLPTEPPKLPVLSDDEASRIKIEDLSPTFRAISKNADKLELSSEQKEFLKDLQKITRIGVFWIEHANPQPPGEPRTAGNDQLNGLTQRRGQFLKYAEQVALVGILSERQAKQVQAVIKKT